VTDSTQSGASGGPPPARRTRLLVVLASVLLLVGSTVIGYMFGRDLAQRPLNDAMQLVHQLQPEVQKLRTQIDKQSIEVISLQTRLKRAETSLHAIRPAENTYNINANQSLSIDNGKLTVGLVGPPSINGVVLNINGKQHHAVTGDLFDVAPDPATACHVKVQSFDMFQTYVNAICTKAK
jgi:hypothetical protein